MPADHGRPLAGPRLPPGRCGVRDRRPLGGRGGEALGDRPPRSRSRRSRTRRGRWRSSGPTGSPRRPGPGYGVYDLTQKAWVRTRYRRRTGAFRRLPRQARRVAALGTGGLRVQRVGPATTGEELHPAGDDVTNPALIDPPPDGATVFVIAGRSRPSHGGSGQVPPRRPPPGRYPTRPRPRRPAAAGSSSPARPN